MTVPLSWVIMLSWPPAIFEYDIVIVLESSTLENSISFDSFPPIIVFSKFTPELLLINMPPPSSIEDTFPLMVTLIKLGSEL